MPLWMPMPLGVAGISVTPLGTAQNTAGATLTLSSVTVPAGSTICILISEDAGSAGGSISDGGVNTYAEASTFPQAPGGAVLVHAYFVSNCSALSGATITYTKRVSGRATAMTAFWASGIALASSEDTTTSSNTTYSATSTPSRTSGTPTVAGELLVGVVFGYVTTTITFTQDAGWTNPASNFIQTNGGGNQPFVGWAYYVNPGTSTKTYAPTVATTPTGVIGVIGFKPQ